MKVHWLEQAEYDVPSNDNWLGASEQARLSSLSFSKRRADWRLGRWTAKHAVAACLNLPLRTVASIEIRAAESGAPEVFIENQPAEVSISLSHRAGIAACLVAPLGTVLGCDLEVVESRSNAFLSDYFTVEEQALVSLASAADREKIINLFWSVKESALKALGVGLRLDSRCAVVRPVNGLLCHGDDEQDPSENSAGYSVCPNGHWHPLQVAYSGGHEFSGWWQQSGALLRTMVASPPAKPPVILTVAAN